MAKSKTRQCSLTKQWLPDAELIRFVVGPDNKVVADIADGRLPGVERWLQCRKGIVDKAVKEGIFSAWEVPSDMLDKVEQQLKYDCLQRLSLAKKAGILVIGFEKVQLQLKEKKTGLLLQAYDGAEERKVKMRNLAPDVLEITAFSRLELAEALGYETVVHVGIESGKMAIYIQHHVQRFCQYTGNAMNADKE